MKRLLIVGALALASAAPAMAADLPPPVAPPPRAPAAYIPAPPPFSWTGFYVGLNAGYGFGSSTWTPNVAPFGAVGSFDVRGPMMGGQIGGNYQFGQFVVGAEGDFDWQNVRGGTTGGTCGIAAIGGCAVASNYFATIRARGGFAADRALFYITGGAAFTNVKPSTGALSYGGGAETGWTAGGGIEYAITDNWTTKIEYLYAAFQNGTCNTSACAPIGAVPTFAFAPVSTTFHENVVRAGVNYKF
jgi:outer membrane immunogenic protein